MAKRYTRINWQNRPSVATPVNATNLNLMDKGIKDCDDAIGDLALLKTVVKTDLVSVFNEQNDNLANNYLVKNGSGYLIGTHDLNTYTNSGRWTIGTLTGISNAPATGCLVVDNCGNFIQQTVYSTGGTSGAIYSRRKDSGVWTPWYKFNGVAV